MQTATTMVQPIPDYSVRMEPAEVVAAIRRIA